MLFLNIKNIIHTTLICSAFFIMSAPTHAKTSQNYATSASTPVKAGALGECLSNPLNKTHAQVLNCLDQLEKNARHNLAVVLIKMRQEIANSQLPNKNEARSLLNQSELTFKKFRVAECSRVATMATRKNTDLFSKACYVDIYRWRAAQLSRQQLK